MQKDKREVARLKEEFAESMQKVKEQSAALLAESQADVRKRLWKLLLNLMLVFLSLKQIRISSPGWRTSPLPVASLRPPATIRRGRLLLLRSSTGDGRLKLTSWSM